MQSSRFLSFRLCLSMTGILLALTAFSAFAEPLSGTWKGSFMIGPEDEREIIFHLQHDGENYTGTLDYPAMASAGVGIDRVTVNGSSISLLVNAMQAEYYGAIEWADEAQTEITRIIGDWSQAGEYVPVTLIPAE